MTGFRVRAKRGSPPRRGSPRGPRLPRSRRQSKTDEARERPDPRRHSEWRTKAKPVPEQRAAANWSRLAAQLVEAAVAFHGDARMMRKVDSPARGGDATIHTRHRCIVATCWRANVRKSFGPVPCSRADDHGAAVSPAFTMRTLVERKYGSVGPSNTASPNIAA